jgi:Tfp pilus assembly protein PilX
MISSFLRKIYFRMRLRRKVGGVTTIVMTTLLLITATLIVLFAANFSLMQSKVTANLFRNQMAYEAAQAGLEFGINYLQQNATAIMASKSGGFIQPYSDANTLNVALANGSKYTITYTNPIASNYTLIKITSTGVSDDGTATRVVSQQVQYGSYLFAPGKNAMVTKGALTASGNTTVTNTSYTNTIESGGALTASGNFKTVLAGGGGSTTGHFGSDIQQNVTTLANTSNSDLFADYFGMSTTQFQAKAGTTLTNNSNYATALNGVNGTTIWINQTSGTATFSGNTTMGTASSPVILVVNGNLSISGNFTLNGFMFVIGAATATTDISGNVTINGGFVATDALNFSGNGNITYNSAVLAAVQATTNYYAKVPGSWKDF